MNIELIPGYARPADIRELFAEYTSLLASGDAEFWEYLQLQHYDRELAHPEEKYGPPWGRLYLALCDGKVAGCVCLRKLDEESCEMKRLYVRPEFQGLGIAGRLVDQLIHEARFIGYRYLLLDTFPFLQKAIGMYRRRGFREIPRYNNSPMDSTIYMKLEL